MGNMSLVRVGGVCAVLVVVSGTMARISFSSGDLVTGHWFDVLALLLLMAAALGFHQALRQAGPLLRIAVVAFVAGIIFSLFHEFIRLGIAIELAPAIADASTANRPALEVMANTLRQTSWLAAGVGQVLIFGVGVPLFSFAILQTSVMPKWIGWLGMIVVVAHVALWTVLSGVFESVRPPWLLALGTSGGWWLAMGVVLLRLKEPVAPVSVA